MIYWRGETTSIQPANGAAPLLTKPIKKMIKRSMINEK